MSLRRLAKSIAWRCFPWADFSLRLSSGLKVSLQNRGDFPILQEIFMERSYAPFIGKLPEIRTWVDLGCNCGLFTLYLEEWARDRDWAGPRSALLVDANRFALRTVRRSLELNELEKGYRIAEGAVGPRKGFVEFYESKSTYKSSVFPLASRERARKVPVVDLIQESEFLGETVDLVKVDIEGGEKLLIEHWGDFLRRVKYVLVEWHEPHMTGQGLNEACGKLGFEPVIVRPPDYLKKDKRPPLELPIGSGLWRNQAI